MADLKCPRCGDALKTTRYEGVEVETCPGCEGEWLDAGELKQIVDAREVQFSPSEKASVKEAVDANKFSHDDDPTSRMECPKCSGSKLERFNYAGSTGIALDRCPKCGGIWLDKDELEQVQILVEQWEKQQASDLSAMSDKLDQVEDDARAKFRAAGNVSRSRLFRNSLVSAIFRHFMD